MSKNPVGRPARFTSRRAIPVYLDEEVLLRLNTLVEFTKEQSGDRSFSASNLMQTYASNWAQEQEQKFGREYYAWVLNNKELLQERGYGSEIERVEALLNDG